MMRLWLSKNSAASLREQLGTRFDKFIEERIVVIPGDITIDGLVGDGVEAELTAIVHASRFQ